MSATREIERVMGALHAATADGEGYYLDPEAADGLLMWFRSLRARVEALERAAPAREKRPPVNADGATAPAVVEGSEQKVINLAAWRRANPFYVRPDSVPPGGSAA